MGMQCIKMTSNNQNQNQESECERAISNGNNELTNPYYPPPTALYQDLTRDANLFWEKLQSFHNSLGTKFKVPTIGGKPLDLYSLFIEVTSRGGVEKVIVDRKWKEVILTFKFRDTITSASFMVRRYYLSLLYHFEQVYYFRKQVPPSTPDPVSSSLANSSTTNRGRAVHVMNDSPVQVSPEQALGSVVRGTIDRKFDGGYTVTVDLGSEQLKGILYHVPSIVSRSSHVKGTPISKNKKKSRELCQAKTLISFHEQEGAISQRIGFSWSSLTEAERQVYQEQGLRDKERYRTEM